MFTKEFYARAIRDLRLVRDNPIISPNMQNKADAVLFTFEGMDNAQREGLVAEDEMGKIQSDLGILSLYLNNTAQLKKTWAEPAKIIADLLKDVDEEVARFFNH